MKPHTKHALWRSSAFRSRSRSMSAPALNPSDAPTAATTTTDTASVDGAATPPAAAEQPAPTPPLAKPRHRKWPWIVAAIALALAAAVGIPWVHESLTTVSTDDAYVNGHVTFVAPRVGGQVKSVSVDDNNVVHKGDLLVELDPEPFQVQVNIAQAAVDRRASRSCRRPGIRPRQRRADAQPAVRPGARHRRRRRQNRHIEASRCHAAIEKGVAQQGASRLRPQQAARRHRAPSRSRRWTPTPRRGSSPKPKSKKHCRRSTKRASRSACRPRPPTGDDLTAGAGRPQSNVFGRSRSPGEADAGGRRPRRQRFVQQVAEATGCRLLQARSRRATSTTSTPHLLKDAPAVKQAEAKLLQAERNLDEAKLNLRYCKVVAEIDGVVTRRNVNPGNNVVAGQSLMAVRSITEIWIDANFKETQLGEPPHRPAGDDRRRHVRQPSTVRRPHFRLHDGHRLDARPAAAAECDGQLREGRAAAARADRPDRLRPGKAAALHRPVGDAARPHPRTADRARTRASFCNSPPRLGPQLPGDTAAPESKP